MRSFRHLMVAAGLLAAVGGLVPAHGQTTGDQSATTPASRAAETPAGPLPLAAFARLPFIEGAKLSPDGEMIAGKVAIGGVQGLVVRSLFEAGKSYQTALPDSFEVQDIRWVGNDNLVLSVKAIHMAVGKEIYMSRLIAFNRKTSVFTHLLPKLAGQFGSDILWIPTDGTTEILVAAQNSLYREAAFWPAVYKVDVVTGLYRNVAGPFTNVDGWIADRQGVVRAGFINDRSARGRTLIYHKSEDETFKQVRIVSMSSREVPLQFTPGEDKAIVIRRAEDGTEALTEIDPVSGKALRTVFQAPTGREIDSVDFDDSGNTLLGVTLGGEIASGHRWIDPALAELQEAFAKSLKDRKARIVSLSANRSQMLVQVDRADEAGRLYHYDSAGGSLRIFADLNPEVNAGGTAKVATMRYKARDGLEIEAIVTAPPGREAKALPVVIMPHGGPWAHDTPTWDYWAQFLASRGYLVIQPNFRGSTGYGDDFVRKGVGQMGLAMQDDVNDALDWAVKQGMADPARACVIGASYGGYVAMWGAARDPDLWRCSVSIAGVANLRREVNDMGDLLLAKLFRSQWEEMTPDFAAVSPIRFVDRIKAPMLLIHGKKDLTVDHGQSKSMFGKMKAAGKNVEFLSLPDADHFFTRQADRVALLTSIEAFLAKHNPAD